MYVCVDNAPIEEMEKGKGEVSVPDVKPAAPPMVPNSNPKDGDTIEKHVIPTLPYLVTYLPTYLLIYLPIYLYVCLHTYLPTYLPT
jgi:hypothetical protein